MAQGTAVWAGIDSAVENAYKVKIRKAKIEKRIQLEMPIVVWGCLCSQLAKGFGNHATSTQIQIGTEKDIKPWLLLV